MSRVVYIARDWQCHAATSVGYEVAGQFVQVAECAGLGRSSQEAEQMAAQIVAALNAHADLVAAATQAARWIAQEMAAKGWPGERVANPPEGSHLFNLRAAIAKATGIAS